MESHKFESQLRLMMMLTQNNNHTIDDFAEALNMSQRNIYRYIESFKMAGFVVRKKDRCFFLDKSSPYFKDISSLVHFTEEEAYVLKRAIESVDGSSTMKQNLKKKLYKVYDYKILTDIVVRSGMADNVHFLYEAIKNKQQAIFKQYKSSNSHTVRDRVVEPFAFTPNNSEIWCYEPSTGKNKLFKVSRIGQVVLLDLVWDWESKHQCGYTDIFHNSSNQRLPVKLRLGLNAVNLLLEEYPLAEKHLFREDKKHWILQTEVCRYEGIARFVLGLMEDIEVLESPEFNNYLLKRLLFGLKKNSV